MEPYFSAWFAGPKSENSDAFIRTIRRILEDHTYWRRNYFPEDGVVISSEDRREASHWNDLFEDKLLELLASLKADCPFSSPRYAAHMVAELTLPGIAGYFAGMLYNPNNVSKEAAPVTVRLEIEVGRMIGAMLGFDPTTCWAHLSSGGTVANLEALWVARTVKYLPFLLRDLVRRLEIEHPIGGASVDELLALRPLHALEALESVFAAGEQREGDGPDAMRHLIRAYQQSEWNVTKVGLRSICNRLGSDPVLLLPETNHYCLPKSMDLLGLGHDALVPVAVDPRFRMRIDHLESQLDSVEAEGRHVLAVVAVCGSTEEGAVDPLHRLLDLRARREASGRPSFWVHVDAAYGGYLRTVQIPNRAGLGPLSTTVRIGEATRELSLTLPTDETFDALERLGEVDSAIVDPHKLGYIPYPAGVVCFRSNLVRPVMRQNAPYVEEAPAGPEAERTSENIGVYILEGSKPGAAAASVWLSHTTIPLDHSGHGALVRETMRNAAELYALLEKWPALTGGSSMRAVSLCPPESNIVCYAFRPAEGSADLETVNALNRRLYRTYSLHDKRRLHVYDQNFFVSRTTLSSAQYRPDTMKPFLTRLGVSVDDWIDQGVFLLRSTLMNPWYGPAKKQGRYYLVGLVSELFEQAETLWEELKESA